MSQLYRSKEANPNSPDRHMKASSRVNEAYGHAYHNTEQVYLIIIEAWIRTESKTGCGAGDEESRHGYDRNEISHIKLSLDPASQWAD